MSATLSRRSSVSVQARATVAVRKAAVAPPKAKTPAPESKTSLSVLAAVEKLKLLSKVEQLGLLSKLEASGLTLSKIEESGLLSFAEKSGVLSLVADKSTPGLLNTTGLALLAATAALVYFVPDESTATVAAQVAGALVLGGAGVTALVAGSTLDNLQKL